MINGKIYKKIITSKTDLSDYTPSRILQKQRHSYFIYILINHNHNIKILYERDEVNSYLQKGYQTIGKKLGSKREAKLIKLVLSEWRTQGINSGSEYKESIFSYLNQLGYCTYSSKRFTKRMMLCHY